MIYSGIVFFFFLSRMYFIDDKIGFPKSLPLFRGSGVERMSRRRDSQSGGRLS